MHWMDLLSVGDIGARLAVELVIMSFQDLGPRSLKLGDVYCSLSKKTSYQYYSAFATEFSSDRVKYKSLAIFLSYLG